jgi:putative hemolysin
MEAFSLSVQGLWGSPSSEGSYHTLAGLVLALLHRVPVIGDRIVFGGWLFEVLVMDGRRVDKVRAAREKLAES